MKPEFAQNLRDLAYELGQEEPKTDAISALQTALMSGQPIGDPEERAITPVNSIGEIQPALILNVNELLHNARKSKKMTQRDLALKAGIDHSTISRIENGSRQPTLPVFANLVIGLGLSPKDTFSLVKAASYKPKQRK